MFKSKKNHDSQFLNNTTLPIILSETCNGIPKVTSTPLKSSHVATSRRNNKVLLSPALANQGTPRRYSLSEASPSTSRTNNAYATSPGPLLASLNYKDNVSMYEETKSSGLARRIVLYNEEAEQERRPTHQEKYNSPGLFPIVHLFKKSPPLLEQSPRRVQIKLSSPEHLKRHLPQHKDTLLDGIGAKPRFQLQHSLPSYSQPNETSTKSVLDALKEISRKRMHSSEEQDYAEESGKRLRTELYNGSSSETSKRTRADSPLSDTSKSPTSTPLQKKFCVYDEFAASKSSSDFSFLSKLEPARSKRKTTSTSTESPTEVKYVKLVNAETQTLKTASSETKTKPDVLEKANSEDTTKRERLLKVFDDAPLERIRKCRLAALMGNLAGKDAALPLTIFDRPELNNKQPTEPEKAVAARVEVIEQQRVEGKALDSQLPLEQKAKELEDKSQTKPLISILSPPKSTKESSPIKSDKHVQFNELNNASPFGQTPSLTQTSASIVTPIVSDSVIQSPIIPIGDQSNNNITDSSFSVDSSMKSLPKPTSSLVPLFSFGNPMASKSDIDIGFKAGTASSSSSSSTSGTPSFGILKAPDPNKSLGSPTQSSTSPPKKPGGFKFDLKTKPSSTEVSIVTTSTTPTPSFSNTSLSAATTNSAAITSTSSTFVFGNPTDTEKDNNSFSFGKSTVKSDSNPEPSPAFGIGGLSKSPSFNFGAPTESKMLQAPATGGFSFKSSEKSPPQFGSVNQVSSSSTPMFGASTTASSNNAGIFSAAATTTSSGFGAFGAPTTTTNSNFGDMQSVSSNASTSFTFGGAPPTTTTMSTSLFGTKPDSIFSAPSNTPAFAESTVRKTENPAPGFSNNNPAINLTFPSAPATSTSMFGNSLVPAFGGDTQQVAKPSIFGSIPTNTTASVFAGSSSAFGTTNNVPDFKTAVSPSGFGSSQSMFSSNPAATTTASVFGTSDTKPASSGGSPYVFRTGGGLGSTFGNNAPSSASTQPLFGSASKATLNPPPYGSNNAFNSPATTTTTSGFNTNNNPTPTFTFGANKPTNSFGAATTTTATTSANAFGTSHTFSSAGGFNTSSSGFGTSVVPFGSTNNATTSSAFGVSSAPAFGQTENKQPTFTFGAAEAKTTSGFGSGAGNSAFGKPANTRGGFDGSNAFGSNNGGFNKPQANNGGFSFGSNAAASATPFGFGAGSNNAEPPKPSFNFSGASMSAPNFGASNMAPAFGASAPTFGGPTPAFTATAPQATGVFNIGAGSAPTGRPRTQLRAKRRT